MWAPLIRNGNTNHYRTTALFHEKMSINFISLNGIQYNAFNSLLHDDAAKFEFQGSTDYYLLIDGSIMLNFLRVKSLIDCWFNMISIEAIERDCYLLKLHDYKSSARTFWVEQSYSPIILLFWRCISARIGKCTTSLQCGWLRFNLLGWLRSWFFKLEEKKRKKNGKTKKIEKITK